MGFGRKEEAAEAFLGEYLRFAVLVRQKVNKVRPPCSCSQCSGHVGGHRVLVPLGMF